MHRSYCLAGLLALTLTAAEAAEWHTSFDVATAVIKHENKGGIDDTALRPQLSFGFTRLVDQNWRVRTAVDVIFAQGNDSVHDENLLNWRLAEIDYRLGDHWAVSAYGGIARYYRERPAYGYSLGIGCKWQLREQWLLAFDFSSATTDISTGVPTDSTLATKDRFYWVNAGLRYSF